MLDGLDSWEVFDALDVSDAMSNYLALFIGGSEARREIRRAK